LQPLRDVNTPQSSTGLSTPVAASLAYLGWWATGIIMSLVERNDRVVRFHAAQAVTAFGSIAIAVAALATTAIVSLSFAPLLFNVLTLAAAILSVVGVLLWAASLWQVASGRDWRIPLAAHWAERLESFLGAKG
jgi:uncharacterized membrane protein